MAPVLQFALCLWYWVILDHVLLCTMRVWESLYSSLKISFCGIQISAGFDAAKASASKNKMLLLINFQMSCFLETGKVAKNICMKIEHADWSMNLLMPLGQTGCGSGRPGLVVGDPARNRGVETSWSLSFLTETILWFYDSLKTRSEQHSGCR